MTRCRHGSRVRSLQAGVIDLERFEFIVPWPRLAIAVYIIIFVEALNATVGKDLGKLRKARFYGLQDVDCCPDREI